MKPHCGNCAHHHEGTEHMATGLLGKGAKRQEYSWSTSEYGGHTSHPNGKCCAPGGRFRGAVTGYYGHCVDHRQRGASAPPAQAYQADISDFLDAPS